MEELKLSTDGMQEMLVTIKAKPRVTEFRKDDAGDPLF